MTISTTQPRNTAAVAGRSNHKSGTQSKVAQRLAPCPDTSNCVSTLATDAQHAIAPLRYRGPVADARIELMRILQSLPRATLVKAEDDYIHMEYRSFLFRFVDDVEIVFDDKAKVIHFRSATRLGRSDLGVNRRRMEKIRALFNASKVAIAPKQA